MISYFKDNSQSYCTITASVLFADARFSEISVKRQKSSRTYLIDYLDFISCEQFFIAWGVDTHTSTHGHTHPHTHGHTHTHIRTVVILRDQVCASHRSVHTWFNNIASMVQIS